MRAWSLFGVFGPLDQDLHRHFHYLGFGAGLGFRVWGVGFGLGFRVQGLI